MSKPAEFIAGAPREVVDLYHDARERQLEQHGDEPRAHRYALGEIRRAGWFRTSRGWRQLTPDLRDKVAVREAIRQPDGRYVIEDVPVFMPNAVKMGGDGEPIRFDRAMVRRLIRNTNKGIESGGAKPALTREGHPGREHKEAGKQPRSYGAPVRWREHPNRPGLAMCDLVDVDPDLVRELGDRRLPGMSAGLAQDAAGLNLRFGHVAFLGADAPALNRLPALELVFSFPNQLCFSADQPRPAPRPVRRPLTFPSRAATKKRGTIMPMDPKKRMEYAAKIAAAYAACQSGAEDGQDKMDEAFAAMDENEGSDQLAAGVMPSGDTGGSTNATGGAGAGSGAAMPEAADEGSVYDAGQSYDFESHPAEAFAAEQRKSKHLADQLQKVSRVAQTAIGKAARLEFSAYCADLRRDGYRIPDEKEIEEHFSACLDAKEPPKALERLKKLLKTYPRSNLSGQPVMFGANAAGPVSRTPAQPKSEAEVLSHAFDVASDMGLQDFSADDAKWAAIAAALNDGLQQ